MKPDLTYIQKNASIIEELAKYSILRTLDTKGSMFHADTVGNAKIRKQLKQFGPYVMVIYGNANNNLSDGVIDSTVIFKSMQLSGVYEIIFDFAANRKNFSETFENRKRPYFIKVTDRIYYRKRELPLM